jgi:hypothetical protein
MWEFQSFFITLLDRLTYVLFLQAAELLQTKLHPNPAGVNEPASKPLCRNGRSRHTGSM